VSSYPNPFRSSDHDPVIVGLDLEAAGGSLTIVKEATPPAPWLDWTFDGDLGPFTLDNDTRNDDHPARLTFEVSAGVYTINETNKKGNWDLEIVCTSTTGTSEFVVVDTQVAVDLAAGDDVTCTYNNLRRPQIKITTYRDQDGSGSREDGERGMPGWQHFLYIADGQGGYTQIQPREVRTNARGIANYTSLEPGVDHLVCAEQRNGFLFTEPADPVIQDGRVCQVVSDLAYGEVRQVNFGIQVAALAPCEFTYLPENEIGQLDACVTVDGFTACQRNESRQGQGQRINIYAGGPDGTLLGRTNGAGDNGTLYGLTVRDGTPYALGTLFKNDQVRLFTPDDRPGGIKDMGVIAYGAVCTGPPPTLPDPQ
jgi:hypothetical protein